MREFTRDQVIADLQANPIGSLADWAAKWGWKRARVQRLLDSLERKGWRFNRSKAGTQVLDWPDTRVSGVSATKEDTDTLPVESAAVSVSIEGVSASHLDTGLLDKSRCEEERYTERLIEAMNAELATIFESEYQPVSLDQRGSHRTGNKLQQLGVPYQLAKDELVRCCRVFNPSKHGRGQLPKSLALFERGIITAFKRDPSQIDLGIPPKLKVDRAPATIPDHSRQRALNRSQLESSPAPELLGTLMSAFIEGQLKRQRS